MKVVQNPGSYPKANIFCWKVTFWCVGLSCCVFPGNRRVYPRVSRADQHHKTNLLFFKPDFHSKKMLWCLDIVELPKATYLMNNFRDDSSPCGSQTSYYWRVEGTGDNIIFQAKLFQVKKYLFSFSVISSVFVFFCYISNLLLRKEVKEREIQTKILHFFRWSIT